MSLSEIMYYLQNKPYFKVYVLSNGRRVAKFIQLASGKAKGEEFFLINKSLKLTWFKPKTPIIDGLQFITFVDIKNAIPLIFEEIIEIETGEYINVETKKIKITVDKNKPSGDGMGLKTTEINYPPALLHQEVEAHFIKEILSMPPSKWEEMKWIWIVLIIAAAFLIWQFMNSGALQSLH